MAEDRIKHAAKTWVETHFPAVQGADKALLILVYGCGMDAGMAEVVDMLRAEMAKNGA